MGLIITQISKPQRVMNITWVFPDGQVTTVHQVSVGHCPSGQSFLRTHKLLLRHLWVKIKKSSSVCRRLNFLLGVLHPCGHVWEGFMKTLKEESHHAGNAASDFFFSHQAARKKVHAFKICSTSTAAQKTISDRYLRQEVTWYMLMVLGCPSRWVPVSLTETKKF